jgi:hypothetical protein
MNFNSHGLNALFEKSLIRIIADFGSDKDPRSVISELTKDLKTKVSSLDPGPYNFNLTRGEDGVYHLTTPFMLYRDSRLVLINLLKWIERSGKTDRNDNLFIDLKFMDEVKGPFKGTLFNTGTKIESIDKLKFILEFDETKIYKTFPSRKDGFVSKSIMRFNPKQKFIPKENSSIDPNLYDIPNTVNSGVNFETLNQGFLRLQYIGGTRYEQKIEEILDILNGFCVTSWNCTINKGFSRENILTFQKEIAKHNKIRESYYDYAVFKSLFPGIKFTVDMIDDKKTLESYYQILRDRIYEIFSNLDFKGDLELNYDTTLSMFQIKEGNLKCNDIYGIEMIMCKVEFGNFVNCDFYDCEIIDAKLQGCNLFLHTSANRCNLFDSFANRTCELLNCEFDGMNGVMNTKMVGGLFRKGKIGSFADISDTTTVIQYQPLKAGYMVVGDKIIIPTKKFRQL